MSCSKCTELRYNRTRILPDLWSKHQSGRCRASHFHPNRAAAVDLGFPTVLEWDPSAYCQKGTSWPTRSAIQPGMGCAQSEHWIQDRVLRAKRVDQFELGYWTTTYWQTMSDASAVSAHPALVTLSHRKYWLRDPNGLKEEQM